MISLNLENKGAIYYFMIAIVRSDITSARAFSIICVTLHSLPITFLIQFLFSLCYTGLRMITARPSLKNW